jgi:hypothetical protein
MHILAFILAIVAIVLFLADYLRSKSFVTLGLAVLTAAWMVQVIVVSGSRVTIN